MQVALAVLQSLAPVASVFIALLWDHCYWLHPLHSTDEHLEAHSGDGIAAEPPSRKPLTHLMHPAASKTESEAEGPALRTGIPWDLEARVFPGHCLQELLSSAICAWGS